MIIIGNNNENNVFNYLLIFYWEYLRFKLTVKFITNQKENNYETHK